VPDWRYSKFDVEAASRERLLADLERVFRELLLRTSGDVDQAFQWLEQVGRRHGVIPEPIDMDELRAHIEAARTVVRDERGELVVGPKGEQALRTDALHTLFARLRKDGAGDHRVPHAGAGGEPLPETRAWRFGDPAHLVDGMSTLRNAMRRTGVVGVERLGIEEGDIEVYETEHRSSCATVLLVDVSHSMILYGEDRITPAKRVALALSELIRTRFPKDSLDVVLFGDDAVLVSEDELPYVQAGPFHTNTRGGLQLAQELLRKRRQANRQILMVTDGKPSALTERDGRVYKNPFGLDERIVNKTLEEAAQCRRRGIAVTTFMLTDDPVLVEFVETFTQVNRGRAYYAGADRLGSFVLVDYVRNRRRRA
jgi:Ca-activated chloride channel family protein